MTFDYCRPVTEAFAFVQYIMTEANLAPSIRCLSMVLMMILHVFRVYLIGGLKKTSRKARIYLGYRAVLTASFGVTGYSLPRD
jgi:cytochrome b6